MQRLCPANDVFFLCTYDYTITVLSDLYFKDEQLSVNKEESYLFLYILAMDERLHVDILSIVFVSICLLHSLQIPLPLRCWLLCILYPA